MKKVFAILIASLTVFSSLSAFDISLRVVPGVFIPSIGKNAEKDTDGNLVSNFSTGFNGNLQADVDLFGFMTAGLECGLQVTNVKAVSTTLSPFSYGIGVGFYYSPISRLYLGAGGAGGLYQISTGSSSSGSSSDSSDSTKSGAGYYFRGYGEVGFRITPELTVSLVGGYTDLCTGNYKTKEYSSYIDGLTAGLGIKYVVPVGKSGSSSFTINLEQDDAAFPLFMSAYRNFELGTLVLRNNESSEIRNVHVSFRAGKYTASTYESANLPIIKKYSSVEVPLLADFSTEILKYSENGKINGEIVVDYELLGKKKQSIQNVVISMYNRNAFYWSDPSALAAFISSDTPEVQQLASIIAGIETNNLTSGMNKNFQMAAAVFEGLRLSGIKNSDDKETPYVTLHQTYQLDSVQYPVQTMQYLSGDLDDMGILLASCLESVGVPTGYMILDDDFIVLVGTNIRAGTEKNHFKSDEGLIVDDDNVYFGLSMTDFQKGFAQSRKTASKEIAAAKNDAENPHDYVGTHAAWEIYPPAVFSTGLSNFEYPSKNDIEKAAKTAIDDYIADDLAYVIEQAKRTGDNNKIGVAYLRSGKLAEAKAEFQKSDSISCMNNLASCYMAEKNYSAAAAQYKKVLAKVPDNKIALRGLDSANEKLGL